MKRDDTLRGSSPGGSRPPPSIRLPQQHPPVSESHRQKRQSLRLRPSEILDNAEPPSPLRDPSLKSVPDSTTANRMSLFHLFSRPKVERARGHAEKTFDTPTVANKTGKGGLKSSASTPNLVLRVQSDATVPPTPTIPSSIGSGPKSAPKLKFKEPAKPSIRERKGGTFEPPPLFQAFPQSVKEGVLELSMMSAESVQQKSKSRRSRGAHADLKGDAGAEDTASLDTKRSTMAHLKHVTNGSTSNTELPKKMFVLVTSGYLLQYAETGPSDRLPERLLHLGKDSAAFACDLVPGKHHVLQVSQTVDGDGIVVINSGSILSKIGIRTAAAKRMTSNFLLVMQSGREMESWMTAIRREIEAMGGNRMRMDPMSQPKTESADGIDLRKTPSQSHRYKVQRSPSMASPVASPTVIEPPLPTPSPMEQDKSDTATIDGIEMEASKLTEDDPPRTRTRSPSDAPSMGSSAALSMDQQQLDNLRSSGSNKRFSKASLAPTVATTVSNSRANSLTGSPPAENITSNGLDPVRENASKPNYRMLASYSSRRRSAAPAALLKDARSLPGINTSPEKPPPATAEQDTESPIVGHNALSQSVASSPPTPKRLSMARSEPNFRSGASAVEAFRPNVPLPIAPRDDEEDRPPSFVGDLPPPSTWSTNRAASRRTSLLQTASAMTAQAQGSANTSISGPPHITASTTSETPRPKRMSTFSIPLKINPSTPNAQPTSTRSRRRSSAHDPDPPGEKPVVHALTATVEPSRRASVTHTTVSSQGVQKSPSQRLSLFPSQLPPTPEGAPVLTAPPLVQQPAPQNSAQLNVRNLRRPTSMQVSSDRAPFLSSVRNSANGPPTTRYFTAPAVPIRGLKPSRSASNVTALAANAQRPSIEALKDLDFGLPSPREDDDKPMQLPTAASRSQSPLPPPSRVGSRASILGGVKTRSSLPELDLGMPVVGLGPPAPPPSAPLPTPPTQSRPGSRMSSSRPNSPAPSNGSPRGGIDAIAGLGIRVS